MRDSVDGTASYVGNLEDDEEEVKPLLSAKFRTRTESNNNRVWFNSYSLLLFSLASITFAISGVAVYRHRQSNNFMSTEEIVSREDKFHVVNFRSCGLSTGNVRCIHDYTSVDVIAGPDGRWPDGVSFKLLKDTQKYGGGINLIYSEHGDFEQSIQVKCGSYSTKLCLHGDHILYTNADTRLGQYISVCDQHISADKAFEFRVEINENLKDAACTKHWTIDANQISNLAAIGNYQKISSLQFDEVELVAPSSGNYFY